MRCLICGAEGALRDNFCRRCGAAQRNSRLPVKRTAGPPVLWRRAAPALVQGAALIAVGVAAEWLLRSAAKGALRLPLLAWRRPQPPKSKAVALRRKDSLPGGGLAISETVIMRRLILRR